MLRCWWLVLLLTSCGHAGGSCARWQVFQGVDRAKVNVEDPGEVTRLWAHEMMRVFHDRLTDDPDRQWFKECVASSTEKLFKERFQKVRGVRFPPRVSNVSEARLKP